MTFLAPLAILCAVILPGILALAALVCLFAWLDLRQEARADAMRRHPCNASPRNLPISEYAVRVAAERIAADHARVDLDDPEYIWALVEVDHR